MAMVLTDTKYDFHIFFCLFFKGHSLNVFKLREPCPTLTKVCSSPTKLWLSLTELWSTVTYLINWNLTLLYLDSTCRVFINLFIAPLLNASIDPFVIYNLLEVDMVVIIFLWIQNYHWNQVWWSSYTITVHHIKFGKGLIYHQRSFKRRRHLLLKTIVVGSE